MSIQITSRRSVSVVREERVVGQKVREEMGGMDWEQTS